MHFNKRIIPVFILMFIIFVYTCRNSGKISNTENNLFLNKKIAYKTIYESYEFKGIIIDINGKYHVNGRTIWLKIKSKMKISKIIPCCKTRFLERVNDSILKVEITDKILKSQPIAIGDSIRKKLGSSKIYHYHGGKNILLSDIYGNGTD